LNRRPEWIEEANANRCRDISQRLKERDALRISSIEAQDVPPVRFFVAANLSDVVVLAGPNGEGKTRLLQSLIQLFRSPAGQRNIRLSIEATSDSERAAWGKAVLDTAIVADAQLLTQTLQATRRRANWKSSVIQFESDRTIQQIRPFSFTWEFGDPWEENYGWEGTFGGLRSRFEDGGVPLDVENRERRPSGS